MESIFIAAITLDITLISGREPLSVARDNLSWVHFDSKDKNVGCKVLFLHSMNGSEGGGGSPIFRRKQSSLIGYVAI